MAARREGVGEEGGVRSPVAFTVSPGGLEEVGSRLRATAVVFEGPFEHDGGDRSLYVRDPDGNVGGGRQ